MRSRYLFLFVMGASLGLQAQMRVSIAPAASPSGGGHSVSTLPAPVPVQNNGMTSGRNNGVQVSIRFDKTRDPDRPFRGGRRCFHRSCFPYAYGYYPGAVVYAVPGDASIYSPESAYAVYGPESTSGSNSAALEAAYKQGALEQRVISLAEEVARLKAEKDARQPAVVKNDDTGETESSPSAHTLATILVFRDGRKVEIGNYAVMGKSLWIFDDNRARKVSLDELDLVATRKINAEGGSEFLLPKRK